jgi:hypothetical protein
MSTLGNYSFLPWLRRGVANQIKSADFDPAVKVRAQVAVTVEARGDKIGGGTATAAVTRPVALFGPGDIVGIDRRAISRVEPRDWITNFEPNYLPHIEFYDEDMCWRYTPAAPDAATGRLRPWIMLAVLAESEFADGRNMQGKPLPYIDVADLSVFPRADELWAWAHVHVDRSLAGSDTEFVSRDMAAVMPRLASVLAANPDLAHCRLVSPRKLAANTAYHAFVVPTFESGRRAGLGLDLADVGATVSAWDAGARPEGQSFPYYHRWYFRTGETGDFESLVRLLVPKPVDRRVGTREMDMLDPGSNLPPLADPAPPKPPLGGILKLGGVLQPPSNVPPDPPDQFETWDQPYPHPLQVALADLVNLADDYQQAGDPDPLITPPLYGTWYAPTRRLLRERDGTAIAPDDNWIHNLNLDPRFRVAAGIGTRVIQEGQERFMNAAWEQIGQVLEAQRRIWTGQFGVLVSQVWHEQHLVPTVAVSRERTLLLMAPLAKRLTSGGVTVHHAMRGAYVQPPMTSAVLRRIVRPRGRLVKSLPFTPAQPPGRLIERVNAGEVSAAPPKVTPPGIVTDAEIVRGIVPADAPAIVLDWLRRFPQLPQLVLVIAIVLALLLLLLLPMPAGLLVAAAVVAAGVFLRRLLARWALALAAGTAVPLDAQTPASVDALPKTADFVLSEPGAGFTPQLGGEVDSAVAARFKEALRDTFGVLHAGAVAGQLPPKVTLDLAGIVSGGLQALEPRRTIPRRVMAGINLPARLQEELVPIPGESFVEPMAYPVIDVPMYEPLKDLSSELFLPNINLIEPNSITLLQTNQRFIEAYMVGLNHEFARELLWRGYPTDQRGTPFRQFWDVRSFFNAANLDDKALKDSLRDIPPVHLWPSASKLGQHDHREAGRENEEELVLVIRGELLKRYPNTVIYAHRACWQRKSVTPGDPALNPCSRSGAIDNTVERRMAPLTAAEEESPPRDKVLTPLYEARVDPDIHFFGFDLTVDKARGGSGENPDDDPGWFFVIKERPGDPRFGLDSEQPPALQVWNDLSWPAIQPGPAGTHIDLAAGPATLAVTNPGSADEKFVQYNDDKAVTWDRATMTSAELAYFFFQAPVLVAVHASEMLPK